MTILVTSLLAISAFCAWYLLVRALIRRLSVYREWLLYAGKAQYRKQFRNLPVPSGQPSSNHTHGKAAASRRGGDTFADTFATLISRNLYVVQASARDEEAQRRGWRGYFEAKDLQFRPSQWDPPERPLFYCVDVDYYLDMREWLSGPLWGSPVLLSTVTPSSAAKTTAEYSYCWNEAGHLVMDVNGGAAFNHRLWDYNQDHICVTTGGWPWEWKYACYLVETKRFAADHSLVLLTPVACYTGARAMWAAALAPGRGLKRINPIQRFEVPHQDYTKPGRTHSFAVIQRFKGDGYSVSVARVNTYACAEVPRVVFDEVSVQSRLQRNNINPQGVLAFIAPGVTIEQMGQFREAAVVLCDYFSVATEHPITLTLSADVAVQRYQFFSRDVPYDPNAKPGMEAFMSPIIDGGYTPDVCLGNEHRSVNARVLDILVEDAPDQRLMQFAAEFAELLVPVKGNHCPLDVAEVYARQGRPTQRKILDEATWTFGFTRLIRSFMKREAYGEPKDPRNISTVPPSDKLRYSRYCYAFTDYLTQFPWYAFGKTPAQIANHIASIAVRAAFMVEGDASRWDGRVGPILRLLEQLILMRFFATPFHEEVLELHKAQYNNKGVTAHGVRYRQGLSRASGSGETAMFNSTGLFFLIYCAFRLLDKSPKEAWACASSQAMVGGDDSIVSDLPIASFVRASFLAGHVMECQTFTRDRHGFSFLARVYGPETWLGTANTMCDVPRQLAKLHLGPIGCSREALLKARQKATSLLLTDANTPLLGHWAQAVVTRYGIVEPGDFHPDTWWAQYDPAVQFPNSYATWMVELIGKLIPEFNWELFQDNVNNSPLKMPLCVPLKGRVPSTGLYQGDFAPVPPLERLRTPSGRPLGFPAAIWRAATKSERDQIVGAKLDWTDFKEIRLRDANVGTALHRIRGAGAGQ